MGMFDYIKCERILPDGLDGRGILFQTKDTDEQYMETYTITDEGRLVMDEGHYETVPKEERPYPDAPDDSLESFFGMMRKVITTPAKDQNFDGVIVFYETVNGKWHEYKAHFIDGDLFRIKAIERDC